MTAVKVIDASALAAILTAYDASYLWLALRLEADLVSLDIELNRAWMEKVRAAR